MNRIRSVWQHPVNAQHSVFERGRPWKNSLFTVLFLHVSIVLITFISYQNVLHNNLLDWDDQNYIIYNPHIKAFTWENVKWMFTTFEMATWHPLTWLSYTLDYTLFGLQPWAFHLTSLLLHCGNTVWLFWLVVALLNLSSAKPLTDIHSPKILWAAGFTALWFGIHPQHVEAVAWATSRKEILCLFFSLPMLLAYLHYATSQTHRLFWYLMTLLSFSLALLSKTMAVTLPVVLFLLDIYPLHRTTLTHSTTPNRYRQLIVEKIPFFALSLGVAIVTVLAVSTMHQLTTLTTFSLAARLTLASNNLIFYLSKFWLPVSFSAFYPLPSLDNLPWLSLLAILSIFGISIYAWQRGIYGWLIGWCFYVITFLPVIGIFQFGIPDAMADRYAYLPTLPIYLLAGVGCAYLLTTPTLKRSQVVITGVVSFLISLGLSHLTWQQTLVWRNEITLWSHAVSQDQDNYFAQTRLGTAYAKHGYFERAIPHYLHSLKIHPGFYDTYHDLAPTYVFAGRLREAIPIYHQLIQRFPNANRMDDICYDLAEVYFNLGEFEMATLWANNVLQLNPHHRKAEPLLTKLKKMKNE